MVGVRLVIMLLVLGLSSSLAATAKDDLIWLPLSEGTAKAKAEKKPMLVDFFYGTGCPRCEALEKEGYKSEAIIQRITAGFIPIRVDLTKQLTKEEEILGEKYNYKEECLLLFLDSEGVIMTDSEGENLRFTSAIESEMLLRYLDMAKDKQRVRPSKVNGAL